MTRSGTRRLAAALFDLDGTLVDTEGQYTGFWGTVGKEYVPDVEDFAYRIKGTTMTNIFATYFPADARRDEIVEKINAFERTMDFPLVAGAGEFVRDLKANGVKCAVVTSSNREKLSNVWRALPEFLRLFDAILTAEDFSASKPAPDCYLSAAAKLGIPAERCVVFEDAPNGLRSGVSAGMFTVGLTTGNPAETIAPLCNRVIPDFAGLSFAAAESWISAREGSPE